jgi:hypothetical protein
MPCYDGNGPGGVSYYEDPSTRRRLDLATRVACEVLRNHSAPVIKESFSKEVQDWWAKHQADDARREAAEKAKKAREKARVTALAKLTAAERKLLGL